MPKARVIFPFVRLSYATPSNYSWWDAKGERRIVTQAEGEEQGDALMPFLFSIGIRAALEEFPATLEPGEQLCAFLDDVYALCQPSRVKDIHDAWPQVCSGYQAFGSTTARQKSGTKAESHRRTWTVLAKKFGYPGVSWCWGLQLGARHSLPKSCSPGSMMKAVGGNPGHPGHPGFAVCLGSVLGLLGRRVAHGGSTQSCSC